MIIRTGDALPAFYAAYTKDGAGVAGLSVTGYVYAPDGTLAASGAAAEIAKGAYKYDAGIASAASGDYLGVFVAADASLVDQAYQYAFWTAGRAGVDNLNAGVDSRAPASTALSKITWTDARAGKLDNILAPSGPCLVTIATQDDDGSPLSDVQVTVLIAGEIRAQARTVDGALSVPLPEGEASIVAAGVPGYTGTSSTVAVTDGLAVTLTLTRIVATLPDDPTLCAVSGRLITGDGLPVVGQTAHADLRDAVPVAAGNLLSKASVVSEPSAANGVFQLNLPRGKKYRVYYDSDRQFRDITVADADTMDLGALSV